MGTREISRRSVDPRWELQIRQTWLIAIRFVLRRRNRNLPFSVIDHNISVMRQEQASSQSMLPSAFAGVSRREVYGYDADMTEWRRSGNLAFGCRHHQDELILSGPPATLKPRQLSDGGPLASDARTGN